MNFPSKFQYFIEVAVPGIFELAQLTLALQCGYNAGADGAFEIRHTADMTIVRFERTVMDEDAGYVRAIVDEIKLEPARAAQLQLARELTENVGLYARPFIQALFAGEAQIIDPYRALDLVLTAEA
jgi:hypothetical protein